MRRIIMPAIALIIAAVFFLLFQRVSLPPESIGIAATQQGENMLIKGRIVQGNGTYRGYEIKYEGDTMLLTVLGSNLPLYKKEFDISVHMPKEGVREIYLTGERGGKILAWQSEAALAPPSLPSLPPIGGEIKAFPSPTK